MIDNLHKNILATIAYYDVMEYPMTAFEIWKYLIANEDTNGKTNKYEFSLGDIILELESGEMRKRLDEHQGFYFLKGHPPASLRERSEALRAGESLVSRRLERNKISEEKYKIVLKISRWLKFIPFIRIIGVAGRVAMKNANHSSDVDLILFFEKGRIFTGRFLAFLFLTFIGKYRRGEKIRNKICLNHFLSTDLNVSIQDLFSTHEYSFVLPIFGSGEYEKFLKENDWIKKYRSNFFPESSSLKEEKDSQLSKIVRGFWESFFPYNFLEKVLRIIQVKKIASNPKTQKEGGVIIYTDQELAFWPNFKNQGPKILERFEKRMTELGL